MSVESVIRELLESGFDIGMIAQMCYKVRERKPGQSRLAIRGAIDQAKSDAEFEGVLLGGFTEVHSFDIPKSLTQNQWKIIEEVFVLMSNCISNIEDLRFGPSGKVARNMLCAAFCGPGSVCSKDFPLED